MQGRSRRTKGGGRTRHICGLVCDSIPLTRRFKGSTASLARKRKNLGAGRLGRISVPPCSLGAAPRSRLAQCCFIRALDPGHSPATSPQPARFTTPSPGPRPRTVRQERLNIKWIPAGAAAAARRRASRRGRSSRGSALRPGAHARPDRGRQPDHTAAPLCPRATVRQSGPADIGSSTRGGSSPIWIFIFWENFFELSYQAPRRRQVPTAGSPAGARRGLAHLLCSCRVPRLYSSFPSWRKTDSLG